jgi:ABC-type nitrate/sulfonate/bicarbonate transport system substrate-binding protein
VLALACTTAQDPPAPPPAATAGRPEAARPAAAPTAVPTSAPAPIPLRVAYASASASNIPVLLANEQELFQQQGLDVEMVLLQASRTDQAVASGEAPVGFGANVLSSRLGGADIVAVAALVNSMPYTLFVRPGGGVQSPQDLRGKTVVSSVPGGTIHSAWLVPLNHYGLVPGQDVNIQSASQGPAEQLAIMVQGLADATLLSPPVTQMAVQAGLVPLLNAADLNLPFLQGTVGANESYTRERPDVIRRVLRTYVSAVALARADPAAAKAALGKYTQTDDAAVLDESYRYYRDLWGRPDFRVSPEAVRAMLQVIDAPGATAARAEEFVDNRFVDELTASGFVRESGALE